MKKVGYFMRCRQDQPSLERLAGMLNRSQISAPDPAVDCVEWELSLDDGIIHCQFPLGSESADKQRICDKVGRILAEYTLSEHEPSLLRGIFQVRYGLKENVEIDALIAEAVSMLDGEPDLEGAWAGRGRERRIGKLTTRFSTYLDGSHRLNLQGFLRFRLSEYRAEVLEAADTAIEERLMERQYQEFMFLLRTMAEWQEIRTTAVHVLHSGGNAFRLLDEQMRPLESQTADNEQKEELEEESRVVSRLLAVSPRQLFIHTPEPESQVIRTIIGIFGNRAALCPDQPSL
ncbi:sporulation protein YtxC [Cohnella yongneupensis]|uniref:Sporulation protein YtxC n=1 Tax=Cohnella yongneupensis TaxID=425006 RepID=A0ABW0QYV4_9BACL